VLSLRDYRDEFADAQDREQFCGLPVPTYVGMSGDGVPQYEPQSFPYTSLTHSARWNAWVYDDSIGIPALDSRYDDEIPW
jgi:hypothetical protein